MIKVGGNLQYGWHTTKNYYHYPAGNRRGNYFGKRVYAGMYLYSLLNDAKNRDIQRLAEYPYLIVESKGGDLYNYTLN